jgi:NitT/TauT family transport system ATP-binding protein
MASQTKKVIEVNRLKVIYNDRKLGLEALKNVKFDVVEHEFVSITGPSGCGKSTLFKILSDTVNGKFTDYSGEVKVLGISPGIVRKQRKIGIVFQKPTLLEWRTVEGNVALPLEIVALSPDKIKSKVSELLKLVELEHYAKFRPSQLSGGMQQRVAIARALAYDPEILLMDEPFAALDEIKRRKLNDELLDIWKKTNKTILFVTHSIEEAVYLSQRIIVLSKQPGTVKKNINIDLPYPRKKVVDDVSFFNYVVNVRKLLDSETIDEEE